MTIQSHMEHYDAMILEMMYAVRTMMADAFEALRTLNKEASLELIQRDDHINAMEYHVLDAAIELLTLQQPVAKDVRLLVGGLKISSDLERIGDYAKNIARFVLRSKSDILMHENLEAFESAFLTYFDQAIASYEAEDVRAAYLAVELDDHIDHLFKLLLLDLSENQTVKGHTAVDMTVMLRNIERAGDHVTNICEQIIYIVEGRTIDFDS